jgi:NAD(P)-dependent dehydrogenase (short-subunit alcohol dehydrogenase family)
MAPRVWLITGCSSGLGLRLAQTAAARGDLVIAGSRNPDQATELAGQKNITAVRIDHNEDLPALKKAIDEIIAAHGPVDVVVNNAAYIQTGTVEELTPGDTLRQFQANLFGPLNLYRAVLPYLRARGQGTLVTIGSMGAWYSLNSCNVYTSSKAALRAAVMGLAGEVRGFGIQHCLVEPGYFRTGLLWAGNMAATPPSARLPEYTEVNKGTEDALAMFNGHQLGNPAKAAEIIYDVVTSTGVAEGKPLPEFLPLGSDACTTIAATAQKTLDDIEVWRSVAVSTDFAEGT